MVGLFGGSVDFAVPIVLQNIIILLKFCNTFCNTFIFCNNFCNTSIFSDTHYVTLILRSTYSNILIRSNTCSSTIFQYYKQFNVFNLCNLIQCNMQYLFYYSLVSPFIHFSLISFSSILLYAREFSILLIDITREIKCCDFFQISLHFSKK